MKGRLPNEQESLRGRLLLAGRAKQASNEQDTQRARVFSAENDYMKCAPGKEFDKELQSCFSLNHLQLMAQGYNKYYNDKITISKDKKELLRQLIDKLKKIDPKCHEQACLLEQDFVRKLDKDNDYFDLIYNTYRPLGPDYKYQWLSTSEINAVMLQYQETFDDFVFFGALPRDFKVIKLPISYDNFFDTLSNLYKKQKTKIGFIFNMDKHNQSGSHWMALYADIAKNQVYFFDSAEDHSTTKPKEEILELMKTIAIWCYYNNIKKTKPSSNLCSLPFFENKKNEIEESVDVRYNRVQHQFANSECGVYAINFIVRLLHGHTFDKIVNVPIPDAKMNTYRNNIFRFK